MCKMPNKKKGTRSATTNFGKEEVLKIREGTILETSGPTGSRVAFVNTIEETANAILSYIYIYIYIYGSVSEMMMLKPSTRTPRPPPWEGGREGMQTTNQLQNII